MQKGLINYKYILKKIKKLKNMKNKFIIILLN